MFKHSFSNTIPQLAFSITYLSDDPVLREQVEAFITAWNAGQREFMVETSGSTGPPKQLVLYRDQLIASAQRTIDYFGLKPGDSAFLGISPITVGGKMMIVRTLVGGLNLFVSTPKANPFLTLSPEHVIDFVPLVPLQIRTIAQEDPQVLQRLKTVLLGGSPVAADLEAYLKQLHSRVFIGFGMTETVSHIAMRKAGSPVYTAMEGVNFTEKEGLLVISDSKLGISELQTNDTVLLINETHFEWQGRADFVINSGGIKIHPEQLERVLSEYIQAPFFVAGKRDVTFGECCILLVDAEENSIDLKVLQDICRKDIGKYAVPRAIIYTPMVYNHGNKIDRKKTLQQIGLDR